MTTEELQRVSEELEEAGRAIAAVLHEMNGMDDLMPTLNLKPGQVDYEVHNVATEIIGWKRREDELVGATFARLFNRALNSSNAFIALGAALDRLATKRLELESGAVEA